jgi:hypothetical protein
MLLHGAIDSLSSAHALIHCQLMKACHHQTTNQHRHSYETLWNLYVLAMVHKTIMWLSRLEQQDERAIQAREMLSRVLLEIHNCQEHLQA